MVQSRRYTKWREQVGDEMRTVLACHGRLVYGTSLRKRPRMAYIRQLFSPAEAAAVIDFATPTLHPSRVVSHDRVVSGGAGVEVSKETRSSWSTKVEVSHASVRHILQRVCALLTLDPAQAEAAQVVRYQPVCYQTQSHSHIQTLFSVFFDSSFSIVLEFNRPARTQHKSDPREISPN